MTLSATELANMRAVVEQLLPDTCNILTVTRTADGAGGWTDSWGTVTASVDCRLDPISGKEQLAGGAIEPFHRFVLTVPYDTTILPAYRIEHSTFIYNIISVDYDKSWPVSKRAIVERV